MSKLAIAPSLSADELAMRARTARRQFPTPSPTNGRRSSTASNEAVTRGPRHYAMLYERQRERRVRCSAY
jgi:hypothetical protein